MAGKKIIWSKRANSELFKTLDFFTERNGNNLYALKILNKLEQRLKLLSENELMGRPTSNNVIRILNMDVYFIFYEIGQENIEIVSFWDNRQDPDFRIDSP
jgi:toxin YoeB